MKIATTLAGSKFGQTESDDPTREMMMKFVKCLTPHFPSKALISLS
jgi:hypothetical protein